MESHVNDEKPSPASHHRAEESKIQELPPNLTMGSAIVYLNVEPCPVKAWIGIDPKGDFPLQSGVVDSDGPSMIQ
jgi:hypothetical protein